MKKVLIVDDSPIMAKLTSKNVESLGYEVAVRENSTRAVSYVGNHKIDIILMDIELMDSLYDGIQTAKLIRKKYNIPVVFITGHEDIKVFELANIETPFDVVLKPYDIKQLKMQMEVALYNAKIENKMRDLEIRFKEIMDHIDEYVIIIDTNGKIIQANKKIEQLIGKSTNKIKNIKLTGLITLAGSFDFDSIKASDIFYSKEPGTSLDKKKLYLCSNQTAKKVEIISKPLKDEDKQVTSYMVFMKEI